MPDAYPRRKRQRLSSHDYSTPTTYFVTICTANRELLFGQVLHGRVDLNRRGHLIVCQWRRTEQVRQDVRLGAFVVMPNHIHALISVQGPGPVATSLSQLVQGFKAAATKAIRAAIEDSSLRVWQRGYYDHIVRNDDDLARIEDYIEDNPGNWDRDDLNPSRSASGS